MSQSNSVNGTLFTGFLATQRYKIRPHAMDIHGVRFCYETGIYTGTFRLDARFLHNQMADSNSVNETMFSSFPAFQRYMLHLYAMDIHGVAQQYVLRLFLALSDSTPDSSTAGRPIPILSTGRCSASSQLSNGIRYVPTRWIFM